MINDGRCYPNPKVRCWFHVQAEERRKDEERREVRPANPGEWELVQGKQLGNIGKHRETWGKYGKIWGNVGKKVGNTVPANNFMGKSIRNPQEPQ